MPQHRDDGLECSHSGSIVGFRSGSRLRTVGGDHGSGKET
jgi:hypothetical protein